MTQNPSPLNSRIRAWLKARAPERFAFTDIADGLGLTGRERLDASWSVALMVRGGMLDAQGEQKGRVYGWVRDPAPVLTAEQRRERRNARARACTARKRNCTQAEYQAERKAKAQAKREAQAAAREARRIERERTAAERAEKRRQYLIDKSRARTVLLRQRREAAKRVPPAVIPRAFDVTAQPVAKEARKTSAETVAEWMARTGQRPQRLRDGEVSKHNRLTRIGAHA